MDYVRYELRIEHQGGKKEGLGEVLELVNLL